jgi:hypothetical protein
VETAIVALKVFQNEDFGSIPIYTIRQYAVRGGWRKLHSEDLYNFYFSLDIIFVTSRRKRWARKAEGMGRSEVHKNFS